MTGAAPLPGRVVRFLAMVLALAGLLAGCGLETDATPQALDAGRLPEDLTNSSPPTPVPDAPEFPIWMVGPDGLLTPVNRPVVLPGDSSGQARAMLDTLIAGTFPAEREAGITTAINRAAEVLSVLVTEDQVAFVDLTEQSIVGSSRDDQQLAFAQIVWTLTELSDVERIVFLVGDRLIGVPIDDAVSRPGQALDRLAFPSLDPGRRIAFPDDENFTEDGEQVSPQLPTPVPAIPPDLELGDDDQIDNRVELVVWLLDDDGNLARRPRLLDRDPESILEQLVLGPELGEPQIGIRSALPTSATVLNVDVDESTGSAFVDLGLNSLPPVGDDERLRAVAQIVYSLTELAEIDQVSISILGRREAMPTQDGLSDPAGFVDRDDYSVLVATDVVGVATPTPEPATETDDDPAPDDGEDTSDPAATPPPEPTPTPTATPTPTPTAAPEPTPTQEP